MTRAELLALAERVEAAAEADLELDGDIALVAGWKREKRDRDRLLWWYSPHGTRAFCWQDDRPPAYSASRDAAASLVPAGCAIQVVQQETYFAAKVRRLSDGQHIGSGSAPTEPRARTAAALRAMAAADEEKLS